LTRKRKLSPLSIVVGAAGGAALAWILFFATGTPSGAAVREPGEFIVTFLNGLTFAGLLFVVASGFTLIFGLMRTVNMAHGSLFLLAAYIAIEIQQRMIGKPTSAITAEDVSLLTWIVPTLIGSAIAALLGIALYQLFLRWNQGEDLRQALITIAISIILADQMLAGFGGLAQTMVWPGAVTQFIEILGERYAVTRLFMLGISVILGVMLWFLLNKTTIGIVIRAGVDDQDMVRALGVNLPVAFGFTFFVGSFLAGIGGAMGASFGQVTQGTDGNWLLNSLVVVIIGGLGSLRGAVAGSLLFAMTSNFAAVYLPTEFAFYAIIATFVMLAGVLAVRPNGLYGRAE